MYDLMEYRIGLWTGKIDQYTLNDLWRGMGTRPVSHIPEEDLTRLFPNGWTADQFKSQDARTKLVDPELILDIDQVYVIRECPAMFTIDLDVLVEWVTEDPYLIGDWGDWSRFFPKGDPEAGGQDFHVAVYLSPFSVPGREGPLEYEVEQAGLDSWDGWWEELVPALVNRHLADFQAQTGGGKIHYAQKGLRDLGFLTWSGLTAWSVVYWEQGGSWYEPPDWGMDLDFLGIVDWDAMGWKTTVEAGQKDVLTLPVGSVKEGPSRPRSILMAKKKN